METAESLVLVAPAVRYKATYLAMIRASLACESDRTSGYHVTIPPVNFSYYVRRLLDAERGLRIVPGNVPNSTYWLLRDGTEIIGECRLRHHLTPSLEIEGGHIGYFIHPAYRGQGYGAQQLRFILDKARARELERVLITCNSSNLASAGVILHNGGAFAGESLSPNRTPGVAVLDCIVSASEGVHNSTGVQGISS